MDVALEGLKPKVIKDMKDQLTHQFTAEEIIKALAQMCPTKAPGPDILPIVFFKKNTGSR